jgi:hypothetical protein
MLMENLTRSFTATIDDVQPGERSVVAKINTDGVDRYRTVIMPTGALLEGYRKNPVVLWEHGQDPARGTMPIGKNQWIKTNERGIVAKTIFKDDAYSNEIFRCYQDGYLAGWSVRMVNPKYSAPTRDEIRSRPELSECENVFRSWELGEYSATAIPGNQDTLSMLVSRGIWIPDNARTMTDSQGGIGGGGAAVIGDEAPQRTKVGPKHAELGKGEMCPEGECERCDSQRAERTLTITEADGSWHVMRGDVRYMSFREQGVAEECLRVMLYGRPFETSKLIKSAVEDVRRQAEDMREFNRQMAALYTTGQI